MSVKQVILFLFFHKKSIALKSESIHIIAIFIRFSKQNKQGFHSYKSIEHTHNLESVYRIKLHIQCLIIMYKQQ